MLGQIQTIPRWVNDLVWQSEILGRRQGKPRWADKHIWWQWRGLGKLEGIGSTHNNKRQLITVTGRGSEKPPHNLVTLFAPGDRLTNTHYKLWYLFLYFGIFHSKSVILLGLSIFLRFFHPF